MLQSKMKDVITFFGQKAIIRVLKIKPCFPNIKLKDFFVTFLGVELVDLAPLVLAMISSNLFLRANLSSSSFFSFSSSSVCFLSASSLAFLSDSLRFCSSSSFLRFSSSYLERVEF